jgi:uncharacterized protein with GYD domain
VSTFALFFSYSADTWAKMIDNPHDRTDAVRSLVEDVGGSLVGLYYMWGEKDGIVLFSAPDAGTAGALALAVTSTGAFTSVQTTQLIGADELVEVLRTAGTARGRYVRPGS